MLLCIQTKDDVNHHAATLSLYQHRREWRAQLRLPKVHVPLARRPVGTQVRHPVTVVLRLLLGRLPPNVVFVGSSSMIRHTPGTDTTRSSVPGLGDPAAANGTPEK